MNPLVKYPFLKYPLAIVLFIPSLLFVIGVIAYFFLSDKVVEGDGPPIPFKNIWPESEIEKLKQERLQEVRKRETFKNKFGFYPEEMEGME